MLRHKLFFLLALLPVLLLAEPIPVGYYDAAQGLRDSLLKAALHDTIGGGIRFHYGTQGTSFSDGTYYPGTWNFFPLTDKRADGTVWDMYSSTRRYYPYDGGSGCGLQIEHCMPKSWWGWTSSSTGSAKRAYQDLYILNPSDAQANGQKSNYPPGHVVKGDKFDNGSFRMDKTESSQYGWMCFEPAECYRGDFARTYFYVVTAYQDITWNTTYSQYLSNDSYLVFNPKLVEVLLDWHRADPVSRKEIERADAISSLQHNRNPFIDYPELVEYIWGNKRGQTVDFNLLTCTASPDYAPMEDFTDFRAYLPADAVRTGFTATWSDFMTDYILDVYTRTYTGSNDTIVNLPAVTAKILNSTPHASYQGKLASAGTNAVTMGSSTTDGAIVLSGLRLTAPATLVFRANMFQTASQGELQIFVDAHTAPDTTIVLPASRDEIRYTYTLPAGTDAVRIASVGGSTSKRACMQELYVVQGNLTARTESVAGYPCVVKGAQTIAPHCSYHVSLPDDLAADTLYYRVRTADGVQPDQADANSDPDAVWSNEVEVVLPGSTDTSIGAPHTHATDIWDALPRKILRNGRVFILHNERTYTLPGRRL